MANNIDKHLDPQTPNGSDAEQGPPEGPNKGADEAPEVSPAEAKSTRCQQLLEQIRGLQHQAVERKSVYQTAMDRREAALLNKDAALKALKT